MVSGPAPQPLAYDPARTRFRRPMRFTPSAPGGEKFDAFFEKYEFKLSLEMGGKARESFGRVGLVGLDRLLQPNRAVLR